MIPRVVDISHHNTVKDLRATAQAGVWGIIHKATQGRAYRDPDYAAHRNQALSAGLLWGAYHFNTGDEVSSQVNNFISAAQPDKDTLLVLDYEDNRPSNMTINQLVQFLHLIEQKVGRKAAIYSGNRLKENINSLSQSDKDYVVSHRLWVCQYGPRAVLPRGFKKYWLWQYTDGQVGPAPHGIAGITGLTDLNVYDGTQDQLKTEWAAGNTVVSIPVA